ncbi:MAG: GNAT family N-acetyltransferase [Deltaproteobacteria bacterium]|nr:GNAT family N-acetyltransferase [Deltaproteobacteria bacterium]
MPGSKGKVRVKPKSELKVKGRLHVRRLRGSDYNVVRALQLRCFPGMPPWKPDQFQAQIERFRDGQLCVVDGERIVASSSSLIVSFDLHSDWHDWHAIADNGYIGTHDDNGDTLYGIEIMVEPDYRGMRLSRRLYEARKALARKKNLARIIIGGRIPGYGQHADRMSPEEYVERVVSKEYFDPVLTAQLSNGFELRRIIPGYLPGDKESRGYATFLEWINLDYRAQDARRVLPVQKVRLAVVQFHMRTVASFEEFARHVTYFVDTASDYHADFLLFPELFTTQLLSFNRVKRPSLAARKLAEYTDQYIDLFKSLAIKYNVNIIGGTQFSVEDGDLYNVAYLFGRDGSVGKQYKLHITPAERRWWGVKSGGSLLVFDTDRGKVAILVCYDIEFPELCRVAVAKGAQIIFVPYNTNDRYGYLRVRYCAQARCIENHVYVAVSGCTGNLPDVDNADIHYAQSAIFTPSDVMFDRDGIAAECTPNIETILVHDVDIELLRRHRYTGTTLNWTDRRKDLYRILMTDDGGPKEI